MPAKQRKIDPTPQRTAIPDEPSAPVVSEKMEAPEPVYNEKTEPVTVADDKPLTTERPRENSRPTTNRNEMSHERSTMPIAAAAAAATAVPVVAAASAHNSSAGQPESSVQADTSRQADTTVHDLVTGPPAVVDESTVPGGKPQLEFPPPPRDVARENDVDMTDAPSVPPVEEQNVVDEPVQPQDLKPVSLPPPPPLQKRMDATQVAAVPPVPDPEPESKQTWLLPPIQQKFKGRKCLILDLDETLVHSSFKILNQADFTIPVEIEGQYHNVYVIKRPGVDQFMKRVGELYEVVVFTASVSKYGDPLLDQLDIHHVVHHRLFRESCYNHQGNYVKVGD